MKLMPDKDVLMHEDIDKALSTLASDGQNGLIASEANARILKYGFNILKNEARLSFFGLLGEQFKSPLVYLLLVACILSFLLKDNNDGIVIAVILVINGALGFFQEFRSEKAVEKLQKLVNKEVLTIREGKELLIPERLLVVGDIVILREGDIVPADIRLIDTNDLTINESQLTGESAAISKKTNGLASLAYAGSTVERGEGKGAVYATGKKTELGKIAHLSSSTRRVTQFEKSLSSFSSFLIRVTSVTLVVVFILKLLIVHDLSQTVSLALFIIALSIAVVPEAMPVIVTVTLSRGALNLAKRHVIAKTLSAVEDLGNITLLCSDKTGTLTENQQTVKKLTSSNPELFQKLAIIGLETVDIKHTKSQNSFDRAFENFVPENIQKEVQNYRRLEELPFDPIAKRRRVVYNDGHGSYLVEIGSVETLLNLTEDPKRNEYLKILKQDGAVGLRHLGIAYKEISYPSGEKFDIVKHEDGLKFVGFVSLEDPLRKSTKETVLLAKKLGVAIKILSGDSREVTQYVAQQVGLMDEHQSVYTGDEIEKLSDSKLSEIIKSNNAFAQVNPEQKYRIIHLLKQQGNVVGYQGDGINDAPSLKLADVGIAVNNATDVAKESADILLLRNDIEVVINGIKYGRGIFLNINKYIRFTFVSNWGNFFALSILYLISISSLPILPVQVLLTSLLTDLPCITIATDNTDTQELERPSKFNIQGLMFISIFLGSLTAVFEIMYYVIIRNYSISTAETGLYLFLTLTALIVILSIRNKGHFWQAPKMSLPLGVAFVVISVFSVVLVYFPPSQRLLSFVPLNGKLFSLTVVMTGVYFVVIDTVKTWFYRSKFGAGL